MHVISLLHACSGPEGTPGDAPPDPGWFAGAELPFAQQECGVVALEGRVIVVGGFDDTLAMVDTVRAYDPAADAWETLAPLPEPAHHANVAVLDGRLHVAGALGAAFGERAVHWVYDPADDGWTELEAPPLAVGGSGVAVLDGRLHVVGGLQGGTSVGVHVAWDGTWETLPDLPTPRDHLAVAALGGRLVVTAGRRDGVLVPATEVYEPATGDWSTATPIPTPRGGVAAAVDPEGRLHVLGGEGNAARADGVFDAHEAWDPDADAWESFGAMRTPRHGTGAAFVGDTLWVPGGATVEGFGAVATNEGWTP